jgi:CubicO group peptidase (beta-lactamase class C family)
LAQIFQEIEDRDLDIHGLLIVRDGYILAERYYPPFEQDTAHELFSATKSVISALVGIAIDKGYLKDLDQSVLSFFPRRSIANPDPRKDRITLEHLLTMTSGLDWAESDAIYEEMYRSLDWVQFVLDRPMADEPGTRFNYNSGNSHLLSAILQAASGMSTMDLAQTHLFGPLGISRFTWETEPSGIPIGGWGLSLTPRDMAKIGVLYLDNGVWDGQQILPADWVRASTHGHVQIDEPLEPWELQLGYGWWLHEFGAYAAHGRGGQFIFVTPDLDLVVVFTGGLDDSTFTEPELLLRDVILPVARSSESLP